MTDSLLVSILNQFIYYPQATYSPLDFSPADLHLEFEDVVLRTTDNITVTGWYIRSPNPRHAVLYCHGNGGNRRDWAQVAPTFANQGCNVLIFDYRGYGDSTGQPSEQGLYQDGLTMWSWLKSRAKQDNIPTSILGKSLGTAIAAYIAAQDDPYCLILDSPFTSMREAVIFNAPWLPKFIVPRLFETLDLI
jgi:fermentation-respiration switch protein FrsA (DUF1100 family)